MRDSGFGVRRLLMAAVVIGGGLVAGSAARVAAAAGSDEVLINATCAALDVHLRGGVSHVTVTLDGAVRLSVAGRNPLDRRIRFVVGPATHRWVVDAIGEPGGDVVARFSGSVPNCPTFDGCHSLAVRYSPNPLVLTGPQATVTAKVVPVNGSPCLTRVASLAANIRQAAPWQQYGPKGGLRQLASISATSDQPSSTRTVSSAGVALGTYQPSQDFGRTHGARLVTLGGGGALVVRVGSRVEVQAALGSSPVTALGVVRQYDRASASWVRSPGRAMQLLRHYASGWKVVAHAVSDSRGRWTLVTTAPDGDYRVRALTTTFRQGAVTATIGL